MSNKTSDKNVENIEDVKVLKDLMEELKLEKQTALHNNEYGEYITECDVLDLYDKQILALQHILAELEQKDKRIKELEEERQLVGIPVRNKRDGAIGIVLHQWKSGSIAVLENINPRVINTHDSWSTLEIITDEIKQTKTKDDSISKQKIKDKIEELTNTKGDFATYIATSERIKVLQELLQESEDK